MHGAGNDFALFDNRSSSGVKPLEATPELVRHLCAIHTGIGADGLMLLEESDRADFRIGFYNADGFPSTMCGNGVRCAVSLAHRLDMAPKRCTFEIAGVIYEAEVIDSTRARVKMQPPEFLTPALPLADLTTEVFPAMMWMDTGVPHLVTVYNGDLETLDVLKWGKYFRYHDAFQPQGANVNFVQALEKPHIQLRVYERGVENETLACGTGAVAVSIFAAKELGWNAPVHIHSPGGELIIEFDKDFKNVYLLGNTTTVFEGDIEI